MFYKNYTLESVQYEAEVAAEEFNKAVALVVTPATTIWTILELAKGKADEVALKFVGADYYNSRDDVRLTEEQKKVVDEYEVVFVNYFTDKYKHAIR